MASFKVHQYEADFSGNGYWVVLRQEIGAAHWIVRVLDLITGKHRKLEYPDEASARHAYTLWLV